MVAHVLLGFPREALAVSSLRPLHGPQCGVCADLADLRQTAQVSGHTQGSQAPALLTSWSQSWRFPGHPEIWSFTGTTPGTHS